MKQNFYKNKKTLFIIKKNVEDLHAEFSVYLQEIASNLNLGCQQKDRHLIVLNSNNMYISFYIEEDIQYFENINHNFAIRVEYEETDTLLFEKIKSNTYQIDGNYRLYSKVISNFIPWTVNFESIIPSIETKVLFSKLERFNLTPYFSNKKQSIMFAWNTRGNVVLVNPFLLKVILNNRDINIDYKELQLFVAHDSDVFSRLFDLGAIPTKFFEYYPKFNKIINYSGININSPGRKIFVKPNVYDIETLGDTPYFRMIEGRREFVMTRILRGENLQNTIRRLLDEELSLGKEFFGAIVREEVEYAQDLKGILTPRIKVDIYTDIPDFRDKYSIKNQTRSRSEKGRHNFNDKGTIKPDESQEGRFNYTVRKLKEYAIETDEDLKFGKAKPEDIVILKKMRVSSEVIEFYEKYNPEIEYVPKISVLIDSWERNKYSFRAKTSTLRKQYGKENVGHESDRMLAQLGLIYFDTGPTGDEMYFNLYPKTWDKQNLIIFNHENQMPTDMPTLEEIYEEPALLNHYWPFEVIYPDFFTYCQNLDQVVYDYYDAKNRRDEF